MSNDKTTEQPIPSDFIEWAKDVDRKRREGGLTNLSFEEAAKGVYEHLHSLPPSPVGQTGPKWVKSNDSKPAVFSEPVIVRSLRTGYMKKTQNMGHNKGWDIGLDWLFTWENTEWLDESPNPSRAGETVEPKRIIPKEGYFVGQCDKCGFKGSSSEWKGGGQIADTGDYEDCYCPVCESVECDEAEDDIYIDQRDLFLKRIDQLNERVADIDYQLFEAKQSKTERAGEISPVFPRWVRASERLPKRDFARVPIKRHLGGGEWGYGEMTVTPSNVWCGANGCQKDDPKLIDFLSYYFWLEETPSPESSGEREEGERGYSRDEVAEICGGWTAHIENIGHLERKDLSDRFYKWFDKNYPPSSPPLKQEEEQ